MLIEAGDLDRVGVEATKSVAILTGFFSWEVVLTLGFPFARCRVWRLASSA